MRFKNIFFRDKQKETATVYEWWEVRWYSRYDEYSGNIRPEAEIFPIKASAIAFKEALEDAYKLIRHTNDSTKVTLKGRKDNQ